MPMIGYARVSSRGQDYQTQVDKLKAAGVEKIFSEKQSGLDKDRPELARCLEYVRQGDVLMITKLDRLARSASHLHQIVDGLKAKGVDFKVLDDTSLDTTTRTGKLVFGILASIAEFETELRKERQMEGIAAAKAKGRAGGRPAKLTAEIVGQIKQAHADGLSIRKIAVQIAPQVDGGKLSAATVQKVLQGKRTVG